MGKPVSASKWHADDMDIFLQICPRDNNCYSKARRELETLISTGYTLKLNRAFISPDNERFLRQVAERVNKNSTTQPKWSDKRQFGAKARALNIIGKHTKTNAEGIPYVAGTTRTLAKKALPPVSSAAMYKCLRREGLNGYKQVKLSP